MDSMNTIITNFLQFQVILKIYHWQTMNYSRHKGSDKLFGSLSDLTDKFVEVLQGMMNMRYKAKANDKLLLNNVSDSEAPQLLLNFGNWLRDDLPKLVPKMSSELLNLRDEMLSEIDQTLYLFTLH